MLAAADERGFRPKIVGFDGWYASLENLKPIRTYQWHWFTRLKGNRLVNPDDTGNVPLSTLSIPPNGRVVHLKGYGFIRVFRTVAPDAAPEYWATSALQITEAAQPQCSRQPLRSKAT